MPLQINDRVKETSNTMGIVPVVLSGASVGYKNVASSIATSNTFPYVIELSGGSEWEIGIGSYASGNNSIIRTQILNSSNNGSIVNFSTGQKNVFISIPAAYTALAVRDLSQFATTTSANLASIISDETGSGKLVFSNNAVLVTPDIGVANGTSLTLSGNLSVSGNISVTSSNVSLGNVSTVHIYGGNTGQLLSTDNFGNLDWIDLPTPDTITYTANSLIQTNGVYVSGNLASTQVFGDYATANNVYTLTDGSGSAPAWYIDFDFISVIKFNRVVLNINYTQSSGHTIYVQLYNVTTSTWDSIGTYTGLGSYYAFALEVIDHAPYISGSRVQLRLYHSNSGNISHTTNIDYVSLEQSFQGPQGPRGPTGATGSTGATGPGVATGGTVGQVLIKNSSTDYDTSWSNSLINAYSVANSAFIQANTGVTIAQSGFTQANTALNLAQTKVTSFYQNTSPTSANTKDTWIHLDTGVKYENVGNTSSSIWIECGPTGVVNGVPGIVSGTSVLSSNGVYSTGTYTGSYTDGIVLDYVNGNGRISVGANDGITLYNGGTGANTLLTISAAGQIYSNYAGANSGVALNLSGNNTIGGSGYFDFLRVTNNAPGATFPTKTLRLNTIGGLEIIDNAYGNSIFLIDNSGHINTSGYGLLTPNRPAFRVVGLGNAISSTTTMTSTNWSVDFNQGSYLNSSTGIFTAPVAGLYQVNVVVRTNSNSLNAISQIIIQKTAYSGGATSTQIMVEFGNNTSMNHVGGSAIVKMAVGDTLKFIVSAGTISFDGNDNWSVAYIG
jgi:hypothetical protein